MKIETVNKKDFIKMMSVENDCTLAEAEKAYNAYLKTLRAAIKTGKRVLVGDMFRIEKVTRKGANRINPKTKEQIVTKNKPRLRVLTSDTFVPELENVS